MPLPIRWLSVASPGAPGGGSQWTGSWALAWVGAATARARIAAAAISSRCMVVLFRVRGLVGVAGSAGAALRLGRCCMAYLGLSVRRGRSVVGVIGSGAWHRRMHGAYSGCIAAT